MKSLVRGLQRLYQLSHSSDEAQKLSTTVTLVDQLLETEEIPWQLESLKKPQDFSAEFKFSKHKIDYSIKISFFLIDHLPKGQYEIEFRRNNHLLYRKSFIAENAKTLSENQLIHKLWRLSQNAALVAYA
ncbi:MAG TPA: hypothetical protein VFA52_00155 [Candidatus Paceibacterota bacterium]|nr:hypothetical protein [Candidatus Paceibacterota bacterium]